MIITTQNIMTIPEPVDIPWRASSVQFISNPVVFPVLEVIVEFVGEIGNTA